MARGARLERLTTPPPRRGASPRRGQADLRWSLPQRLVPLSGDEAAARGLARIDPQHEPPDPLLVAALGAEFCLSTGLLPWRRRGGAVVVLSGQPGQVRRHMGTLTRAFGAVRMAHAPERSIRAAILAIAGGAIIAEAESRVAAEESCRGIGSFATSAPARLLLGLCLLGLGLAAALWPGTVLAVLTLWAVVWMLAGLMLKLAAFRATIRAPEPLDGWPCPDPLPLISILVPLLREAEIAAHLLPRLTALEYPREALDLCLIVEDDDLTTRAALAALDLPAWAQVIEVPQGTLRTKPRAMNFALPFAKGSIIGIYDAEDLPHPRQLLDVAARFARSGEDTACLQGRLDYYNPSANWLARCFTLEYAAWFRVILPGLDRLGLVVPLGGTTLFLRRAALDAVGGWDAHNVTEDADLGLRLARHGYRTEVIHIVTEEEANARLWPWVRQRSRWLKGYAMTWFVHMRRPARLLHDLGWRRFAGVQVLFLGTLSQLALAPLIWLFWLPVLGLPHPLAGVLPTWLLWALGGAFLASTAAEIAIHIHAARAAGKAWLVRWIPTLVLYHPLATLACWRGLLQICSRPFYWDKTSHGIFCDIIPPPEPLPRPVSDA
jgi:cellulose synthase/poly-beta-1,6-N-acetylglucosamine synthase-like glycosyltransferase